MSRTAEAKKQLLSKRKRLKVSKESAVSTGSTLLNLACTDRTSGGFVKGGYFYLVGDSTSGKTWLSLTCFAEACLNEHFKDYKLIFDDVEGGALMDIEHYFGKEVAKKMQPPTFKNGKPACSETVEDFYYNISDHIEKGDPFIYVLDSQDALDSDSSIKKFKQQKKRSRSEKDEEGPGSYGDGKAKYHSEHIRSVRRGLERTNSILIVIGQTRDNLGFGFEKKTRSGGRSLRFYANLEIWTSVAGKIAKTVRKKKRTVGVIAQCEVKKNRISGKVGKDRSVSIPIYYSHGIDDVGSCVDYLISESRWSAIKGKEKVFDAEDDLGITGSRDKIVSHVEENDLENKLRRIVGQVWREIEEESRVKRKPRYK